MDVKESAAAFCLIDKATSFGNPDWESWDELIMMQVTEGTWAHFCPMIATVSVFITSKVLWILFPWNCIIFKENVSESVDSVEFCLA